jgi:sulfate adenylyltransferase subunit 1 (EFTu-like GTPase family)
VNHLQVLEAVALRLEDELDIGRGSMICRADERPRSARDIEATVCWLGESPARTGGRYVLKHTTRSERARLETVHETMQVATLESRPDGDTLGLNDVGRVALRCASELVFDPYGRTAPPARSSSSTRRRTTPWGRA